MCVTLFMLVDEFIVMEPEYTSKTIWCLALWLVAMLHPMLAGESDSVDSCPDDRGCSFKAEGELACYDDLDAEFASESTKIRTLTLCRWPQRTFEPAVVLASFPYLQKLTLMDNNVTNLVGDFNSSRLEVLNITGTRLEILTATTFTHLETLRVLDLRGNNLAYLEPSVMDYLPFLQKVYLSDNPWNCSSDLTWLIDDAHNRSVAHRVIDRDKMECSESTYPTKPVLPVMGFLKTLQEECPKEPPTNCTCSISHVVWNNTKEHLFPVISVDCNNLGLQELPPILPTNTTILLVKGNKISDLQPLVNNEHYSQVLDIHLDDNLIKSIAVLEGANWLSNFRFFSLRNNQLTHLPTYALDNALKKNHNAVSIYLGDNPWQCDCQFTPSFQELLVKYIKLVKDISEVKCSNMEGSENSLAMIRDISRNSVCREPSDHFIQPLDVLNGILASLIVFILGKLAYDYWAFKRTGKLPWIVSKMP